MAAILASVGPSRVSRNQEALRSWSGASGSRVCGEAGILERVTEQKRAERAAAGPAAGATQAAQMGITSAEAAFTTPAELFGCADWTVAAADGPDADGSFEAHATRCMLCALAKKLDAPSPCHIFCLDPIESIVSTLRPDATFEVQETLYAGEGCRVRVGGG